MTTNKLNETVEEYIARVFPCKKPCDSYGICENCMEAALIKAGASIQKKLDAEALKIAIGALEKYAALNAEIIQTNKLYEWLEDCKANPENFISGVLYKFGLTNSFAHEALEEIRKLKGDV